ncbi:hypothetical protein [Gynuella sunshinyii]|uniref:Porin n=1 Tax=Gynuella sunshinyii YC6258 TaxID=1445510 RepID=A0A0C5W317_9GAMM|nr:hypothetical protein [Gynuella sunshinyii]AJQ97059.1 hypothetical Protein YC6258_05027 [Gynuella sunshinyii YC6258]
MKLFLTTQYSLLLIAVAVTAPAESLEEPDWLQSLTDIDMSDVQEPSPWYGTLSIDAFVLTDKDAADDSLARIQAALTLGWQGKLAESLSGRFELDGMADNHEFFSTGTSRSAELHTGEFYLDWRINTNLTVKAGREKIGLGYAQGSRVLEAFSPMDSRISGYGNLQQLKLPVAAVDISYHDNQWTHRLIVIPEQRNDRIYLKGPYAQMANPATNAEWYWDRGLYALGYQSGPIDWRVAGGQIYNPSQRFAENNLLNQTEQFLGAAVGFTRGAVRVFTEGRGFRGIDTWPKHAAGLDGNDILLGLTYTGISNAQIQIEAMRSEIAGEISKQLYLSAQYTLLRDSLTLSTSNTYMMSYDALVTNTSAEYEWLDGWKISIGLLNYHTFDENSRYSELENKDSGYIAISFHW